jgi:hypothetical protein
VGVRDNGLLLLFYLRTPQAPQADTARICTVAQKPSGDTFGSETCLGSPSTQVPDWTSAPAAATGADGHFWLFAKNDQGGVSVNHEVDQGVWSGWTDLPVGSSGEPSGGGPDVIEGIVAARDALGRVQVFAQTRFGVIHQWYQQLANGPWVFVPAFPANAPSFLTHGVSVGKNANGRLEVFYRGAGRNTGNAHVFSVREASPGGAWGPETDLYGDAGQGPLAVALHSTGPLQLFEFNYYGGVSGITEVGPNGSFAPFQWTDLSGTILPGPSATSDSLGRTALAAFGLDGRLYLRRQTSGAATAPYSDWALVETGLTPPTSPKNICVAPRK